MKAILSRIDAKGKKSHYEFVFTGTEDELFYLEEMLSRGSDEITRISDNKKEKALNKKIMSAIQKAYKGYR